MVRKGTGAPARCASSKKMNCSTAERPWPPYSFGQPMPSQPSRPIRSVSSRYIEPPHSPFDMAASTSGVISSAK